MVASITRIQSPRWSRGMIMVIIIQKSYRCIQLVQHTLADLGICIVFPQLENNAYTGKVHVRLEL
jgi:hypothetical protein